MGLSLYFLPAPWENLDVCHESCVTDLGQGLQRAGYIKISTVIRGPFIYPSKINPPPKWYRIPTQKTYSSKFIVCKCSSLWFPQHELDEGCWRNACTWLCADNSSTALCLSAVWCWLTLLRQNLMALQAFFTAALKQHLTPAAKQPCRIMLQVQSEVVKSKAASRLVGKTKCEVHVVTELHVNPRNVLGHGIFRVKFFGPETQQAMP